MRSLRKGNTYVFELRVLGNNNKGIDLSNVHDVKYVMTNENGDTVLITKSLISPDVEMIDSGSGIIKVKITNNETKDLPVAVVYHEVGFCDDLGNLTTLMSENVEIVDSFIINC